VAQDGGGVTKTRCFDSILFLFTPFIVASFRQNEQPVDLGRP
jgi:hypothetical protein